MNKEFIPYQEALALKELGFDEDGLGTYSVSGQVLPLKPYTTESKAILFSQAFRWFREKHNLEYQIIKSANGNYSAVIHLNTQEYLDKISTLTHACLDEVVDCYSYEEAELACLVKLIEIANKTKYSSNDAPTWYN